MTEWMMGDANSPKPRPRTPRTIITCQYGVVSLRKAIVNVAVVDQEVIRAALALDFADLEDAVQVCAGAAPRADYVVTRNLRDFARGPLPAVSPAELLPLLSTPFPQRGLLTQVDADSGLQC